MSKEKTILIAKCSNSILWYSTAIDKKFVVSWEDDTAYYVRTNQGLLDWVYKTDAFEIVHIPTVKEGTNLANT